MANKQFRVCIVTFPVERAFIKPLKNLESVLNSFSDKIYRIYGVSDESITKMCLEINQDSIIVNKKTSNIFLRIVKYIFFQLKISLAIVKTSKKIDVYVFFMEGDAILPMVTTKLLRKKSLRLLPSFIIKEHVKNCNNIFTNMLINIHKISYALSTRIIVYSPNIIEEWGLEKYRNKIYISHEHFLDFHKFKITKNFNKRSKIIGYIGRLSEEKGILNFIQSIPGLLKEMKDLEFLIAGDGKLKDEIKLFLKENKLEKKVKLLGWIQKENLPTYYNQLKIIVIPSYTEGLPNVMLEAIACGTPVVATSVGAISDIIKCGETGYVIEDNNPECIKKTIIGALQDPNIEVINENARKYVTNEFNYESTVNSYKKIIDDI
jgi:glycosyltransferase involved in cell wall biosynthesis